MNSEMVPAVNRQTQIRGVLDSKEEKRKIYRSVNKQQINNIRLLNLARLLSIDVNSSLTPRLDMFRHQFI